jgi:hypothetical protein
VLHHFVGFAHRFGLAILMSTSSVTRIAFLAAGTRDSASYPDPHDAPDDVDAEELEREESPDAHDVSLRHRDVADVASLQKEDDEDAADEATDDTGVQSVSLSHDRVAIASRPRCTAWTAPQRPSPPPSSQSGRVGG